MAIAHLEWSPGGGVEQEVRYKKASDGSYTLYNTVSTSTNEIDIPDLDPNTVYDFVIINKCLFDIQSSSLVQETALVECPLLDVEQTALALTISFTHLGADIDSYVVEIYEMPSETFMNSEDIDSPSGVLSVTFDGLVDNTYYKIKVIPKIGSTYENDDCSITERTLGCAEDYTLAPDGSYCYKVEEVAADPPAGGTPEVTEAKSNDSYGTVGSYIYDFGFNVNGTGTSHQITVGNTFWINGDGSGLDDPAQLGPLNRCGLWTASELDNQDIGFSVCLDITESKVYYIGVGGDNRCRIVIDGQVVVDQDASAVNDQYVTGGAPFKVWHIYPFTLSSGPHIIELVGHNDSGPASLGAEIYNNTSVEISTSTSYDDLTMVFSTIDYIGQPVQLSTDDLGYSCPSGYALAACEDPFVCRRILTALPS